MKILCPVDFSQYSVNAANWSAQFLGAMAGGNLHLINCINTQMRAEMFTRMDELFLDKAKEDISQLYDALEGIADNISITSQVVAGNPKSYITSLAKKEKYDFIVTGTKGLNALKDMTVGSVTEYLINKSQSNIFAIPAEVSFKPLNNILLGVDDKMIEDNHLLDPLLNICREFKTKLHMVHVKNPTDSPFEYDPAMDIYLEGIDYDYKSIQYENSVAESLDEYADYIEADALCMIHRKKNWFQLLFNLSTTKSELFHVHKPLLVLNYNK